MQSFSVLVSGPHGSGELAVFGDDAMFQNRFLTGQNLELAHNLAAWLSAPGADGRVASREPSPDGSKLAEPMLRQSP